MGRLWGDIVGGD